MRPISRRRALTLGGVGLVGAVVGGTGLWRDLSTSTLDPVTGGTYAEPEVLSSDGGLLEVRLEAAVGDHEVAGRTARTMGFNGGVPGPTLRLRPGDTLRVELVNRLERPTNLHVHGLHVSPEGKGDDVFLAIGPGRSQQYEYQLPGDHPPGVYWYHPHHHGTVADQMFAGLYGAIIVEEDDAVPVDRERVMVISDITLDTDGSVVRPSTREQMMGREGALVLLNGRREPVLEGRSGERERWRIVNACTSRYLAPRLPGQTTRVVGRDVGRLPEHGRLEDVVLAPGNRLDLVVDLGEGSGGLTTDPVDRGRMMGGGPMGGRSVPGDDGPVTLAQLEVTGGTGSPRGEVPSAPPVRDLRGAAVDGRRSLTFQMGMGGMMGGGGGPMSFTIDGETYDAERTDQRVRMGTVEEWRISNDSPMDHPFHLHVWPMQVLEVDGRPLPDPLWLDVVNVPARSEVTVRVAFEDFDGRTVYHCHILDHEDRGMMGTILAR